MKIVIVSNYDRDEFQEKVLNFSELNERALRAITELLNNLSGTNGENYYVVKEDDYQLRGITE